MIDSYLCLDPNHELMSLLGILYKCLRPKTLKSILDVMKIDPEDTTKYLSIPFGKGTLSKLTDLVYVPGDKDRLEAVNDINSTCGILPELDGLKENLKLLFDCNGGISEKIFIDLGGASCEFVDYKSDDGILRIKIDESDINNVKISYDCYVKNHLKKISLLKNFYNLLSPVRDRVANNLSDDALWNKINDLLENKLKPINAVSSTTVLANPNTGEIVNKREPSFATVLCNSINRNILSNEVETLTVEGLEVFGDDSSKFSSENGYVGHTFRFKNGDATLTMDFVPSFGKKPSFDVNLSFNTDDFHKRCALIEALGANIRNSLGKKVAILYGNGGGGDIGETVIN